MMYSATKSSPKMRRALTPRVRSSQNVESINKNHVHNLTNQKNHQNNNKNINPEKVEEHLNKKLNGNWNGGGLDDRKIGVSMIRTEASLGMKNGQLQNNQQNNKKQKQTKIVGRDIQWFANNNKNKNNININKTNQSQANHPNNMNESKNRCMSARNLRSSNLENFNSSKSIRIKQDRKQFQDKFNVAFDYLLKSNSEYLNEKLSMCNQKARPKEKNFKIQRPNIKTAYKDFHRKVEDKYSLEIEPQNQKTALFISPSKICGNSTSQEFHTGRNGKKADLAEWPEGFKLQGPMYSVTVSQNAFPHHGDFEKMVPIATFNEHPLGMPQKQTSTHRRFFKGEHCPPSNLATWNNLNPVANYFSPNRGTHYQTTHGKKQKQPIQQWPHPEHKHIIVDGKFTTESRSEFVKTLEHELNNENRCRCGRSRH